MVLQKGINTQYESIYIGQIHFKKCGKKDNNNVHGNFDLLKILKHELMDDWFLNVQGPELGYLSWTGFRQHLCTAT